MHIPDPKLVKRRPAYNRHHQHWNSRGSKKMEIAAAGSIVVQRDDKTVTTS